MSEFKVGDVVRCTTNVGVIKASTEHVITDMFQITTKNWLSFRSTEHYWVNSDCFELVENTPVKFKDMSHEAKKELIYAVVGLKRKCQIYHKKSWVTITTPYIEWHDNSCYRLKPEPSPEVIRLEAELAEAKLDEDKLDEVLEDLHATLVALELQLSVEEVRIAALENDLAAAKAK